MRAKREGLGLSPAEVPCSYSWLTINPLHCLGQISRLGERILLRNPEAQQVFPASPSGSAEHLFCLPSLLQPEAQAWPPPPLPPLPWQGHPLPTPCQLSLHPSIACCFMAACLSATRKQGSWWGELIEGSRLVPLKTPKPERQAQVKQCFKHTYQPRGPRFAWGTE